MGGGVRVGGDKEGRNGARMGSEDAMGPCYDRGRGTCGAIWRKGKRVSRNVIAAVVRFETSGVAIGDGCNDDLIGDGKFGG